MAEIRLSKIIKQYNIGLQDLVDFLNKQGAGIEEANPNLKVSDEYMPAVSKQFGKDLEMLKAAEKVDIKLNEILEKTGRRQDRSEEEEEDLAQEMVIKSTIFQKTQREPEPKPAPKPQVSKRLVKEAANAAVLTKTWIGKIRNKFLSPD